MGNRIMFFYVDKLNIMRVLIISCLEYFDYYNILNI
jgi:hypothetical protein